MEKLHGDPTDGPQPRPGPLGRMRRMDGQMAWTLSLPKVQMEIKIDLHYACSPQYIILLSTTLWIISVNNRLKMQAIC